MRTAELRRLRRIRLLTELRRAGLRKLLRELSGGRAVASLIGGGVRELRRTGVLAGGLLAAGLLRRTIRRGGILRPLRIRGPLRIRTGLLRILRLLGILPLLRVSTAGILAAWLLGKLALLRIGALLGKLPRHRRAGHPRRRTVLRRPAERRLSRPAGPGWLRGNCHATKLLP